MPLVSVIVRTLGRDTLERALGSLAAQTRPPDEILLVDSAASGLLDGRRAGTIPVRVVGAGPYDRVRAANAGLQAARGDWIAFLDDDDELEPRHFESLLAALAATPGALTAYSQTRLVGPDGSGRVFGGPFDRFALFRSNYIAIHAALFARAHVEAGCRFDAAFAMLEDWDFWLQLAARGPFAFSAAPTALYRAGDGASGAGLGVNLDREALATHREKIRLKWGALQARLAERERYARERAESLSRSGRAEEAAGWRSRAQALRHGDPGA